MPEPHAPLRFVPPPRSHLKSATVRTLLRIFSHLADDSHIVPESPVPGNAFDPLLASFDSSKSERPTNSSHERDPSTDQNSHTGDAHNEVFCEGRVRVGELGQVIPLERSNEFVDGGDFGIESFGKEMKMVTDGNPEAVASQNEISRDEEGESRSVCNNTVLVNLSRKENSEAVHVEGNADAFCDKGSLIGEVQQAVMQGNTDKFMGSISGEFQNMGVEEDQPTVGNPNAFDVEPEKVRDKPVGELTQVTSQGENEELVDGMDLEIVDLIMEKDSAVDGNTELNGVQSSMEYAMPQEGKVEDSLVVDDVIIESMKIKEVVTSDQKNDSISSIGEQEIEEGEISGDTVFSFQSLDSLLEGTSVSEEIHGVEDGISNALNRNQDVPLTHEERPGVDDSAFLLPGTSNSMGSYLGGPSRVQFYKKAGMTEGLEDNNFLIPGMEKIQDNGYKVKMQESIASANCLGSPVEVPEKILCPSQGKTSKEKEVKIREKKKGGPLTEARKSKKKLAKKRKRAEMNRKQGVKRLKLEVISKPKVVHDCKYYLKGRCQQGEKCKFSHDIVPLTKSQPCKYFACNSCLKGDDCPFDHQLSKYPCNNFKSKGTCGRGDSCLFSHKILVEESSPDAPTVQKSECLLALKKTNLAKQLNANSTSHSAIYNLFEDSSPSMPSSLKSSLHKQPKEQIPENRPRPSARVPPEGISFLSFGKSPLEDAVKKQHQDNSSLKSSTQKMPCRLESPHSSSPSIKSSTSGPTNALSPSHSSPSLAVTAKIKSDNGGGRFKLCSLKAETTNGSKSSSLRNALATHASAGSFQSGALDASQILEEFLFGASE